MLGLNMLLVGKEEWDKFWGLLSNWIIQNSIVPLGVIQQNFEKWILEKEKSMDAEKIGCTVDIN